MTNSDPLQRIHLQRIHGIVDLDRFPIHDPDAPAYRELVGYCRDELAEDGCCSVGTFLRPEAITRISAEAETLAPQAYRTSVRHNPYFSPDDESFPEGHPRRRFQDRTNGFVCYDLIPSDSDLRALYDWPAFTAFLSDAFDIDPLYRYADPLAAMPFNTMRPGDQFPWHFDTNEFTVTLMIQPPEGGGLFEYAPSIRSTEDECYDAVEAVMAETSDQVRRLDLRAGDMQLFLGRFTLHRVTPVTGARNRHVAIPSWARIPNMIGSPHRTETIYGRLTEAHLAAAQAPPARVDALVD